MHIDKQHPQVYRAQVQVARAVRGRFLDLVPAKDRDGCDLPAANEPTRDPAGIGGTLVREALDQVRASGLKVLPICPFVQAWMLRHPDYAVLDYRHPTNQVTD